MPVHKDGDGRWDQIVSRGGFYIDRSYPQKLRCIKFYDAQRDKRLTFLISQFTLLAVIVVDLYRCRRQVETFFKWIKEHLRTKALPIFI